MKRILVSLAVLAATGAAPGPAPFAVTFEARPRAVIAEAAPAGSTASGLAFSPSGNAFLMAGVRRGGSDGIDVFVSRDGGDSFGSPIAVVPSGAAIHGEASPTEAVDPRAERLYALWQQRGADGAGLRVAHASLYGAAFSVPVALEAAGKTNGSFATSAVAPGGDVYGAWLAGDGQMERTSTVYVARSIDQGATFARGIAVAHSACPCCRPSFAIAGDGTMYLAWRDDFPGDFRDVVLAASHDQGQTWSAPVRVNRDGWSIRGCPNSGPALTIAQDGTLVVAWFTLGTDGRPRVRAGTSRDGTAFTPAVTISGAVDDPNHPSFATGPAPYPVLVFEGRDPGGAGFGKTRAYVAALRDGRWTAPRAVPSGAGGMAGPVAAMRDGRALYVAGTAYGAKGEQAVLVRGRLP